jgi:plasmid replication initiation protein
MNELSISSKANKDYSRIKAALTGLQTKIIKAFDHKNNSIVQAAIIGGFLWDINGGKIYINFDPYIYPALRDFSKGFTRYRLVSLLNLQGKYSKRFYMELNNWTGKIFTLDLATWREKLQLSETYHTWSNFNARVLQPAIEEINQNTELQIKLIDKKKSGRRVDSVQLSIGTIEIHLNDSQKTNIEKLVKYCSLSDWQSETIVREITDGDIRSGLYEAQCKKSEIKNMGGYMVAYFERLGVDLSQKKYF